MLRPPYDIPLGLIQKNGMATLRLPIRIILYSALRKNYLRPLYETQHILILREDYNILGYLSTHTHMQISNDVRNGMKYV